MPETDEQLARRLHEELNALTRHSRRAAAPAPGPQQQLHRSKSERLPESKASKTQGIKQRVQSDAEGQLGTLQQQGDKQADRPARKRSMLNRELAMLVTDMVDSQIQAATGPRQTKSKDEQVVDQHKSSEQQQHLQVVEQLLPILKHESSSSQSEQERLALEHVQAAVADGTPQAKQAQQRQQHFMARVSACPLWSQHSFFWQQGNAAGLCSWVIWCSCASCARPGKATMAMAVATVVVALPQFSVI